MIQISEYSAVMQLPWGLKTTFICQKLVNTKNNSAGHWTYVRMPCLAPVRRLPTPGLNIIFITWWKQECPLLSMIWPRLRKCVLYTKRNLTFILSFNKNNNENNDDDKDGYVRFLKPKLVLNMLFNNTYDKNLKHTKSFYWDLLIVMSN